MDTSKQERARRKELIRDALIPTNYGYPTLYLKDGEPLCTKCVRTEVRLLLGSTERQWTPEWVAMYWEGPDEECANCYATIPTVYGDPDNAK